MESPKSLTGQLRLYARGERADGDSLLREIFPRLRQIAARKLRREHAAYAVTPTDLVGETWATSLHRGKWKIDDREHFFGIAGKAMQNALIDMARRRLAQSRGKGMVPVSLDDLSMRQQPACADAEQVIQIGLLLEKLEKEDPKTASVVSLHYVLGLSLEETAEATGSTPRQVRHLWEKGKSWLAAELAPRAKSRSLDRG